MVVGERLQGLAAEDEHGRLRVEVQERERRVSGPRARQRAPYMRAKQVSPSPSHEWSCLDDAKASSVW